MAKASTDTKILEMNIEVLFIDYGEMLIIVLYIDIVSVGIICCWAKSCAELPAVFFRLLVEIRLNFG